MEVSVLVLMSVLRRLKDGLLGCFLQDRFVYIYILHFCMFCTLALLTDYYTSTHILKCVYRIRDVTERQ